MSSPIRFAAVWGASLALLAFGAGDLGAETCNVRDHGAQADGQTNDAPAIQAAIDACAQQGGGTVCFPPGQYLSGMVRLRSHVTLHLENGAVWQASPRPEDYVQSAHVGHVVKVIYYLIEAEDQEQIGLEGEGLIRGVGEAGNRGANLRDKLPPYRIATAFFQRCRDVTVRDLKFRLSGGWTLHFDRCQEVFVDRVSIVNNYFRTVTDGIDPVSCQDVHISNCHISSGDDCICLKTRGDQPCRDVVVTNCTLESAATAIKLGTESEADFSDVRVENCTIRNSTVGIGIYIKDGARAERLSFSNLSIRLLDDPQKLSEYSRNSAYPVFIDVEQRQEDSPIGRVRDVAFENLQIYADNGLLLQGMPESPLENVSLRSVTLRVERGFDYARRFKHGGGKSNPTDPRRTCYAREPSYLTAAYVRGLVVDDLRLLVSDEVFDAWPRSALSLHEVCAGTLRGVTRRPSGKPGAEPVIRLHNCRELLVTGCDPADGTPLFLGLTGSKTAGIALTGNDLSGAAVPVAWSDGARADSVRILSESRE